jgi:hypothetical protein
VLLVPQAFKQGRKKPRLDKRLTLPLKSSPSSSVRHCTTSAITSTPAKAR